MTVSATTNRMDYLGNGTAGPFAYNFKIFSASHLYVYVDGALRNNLTHYTVSGVGSPSGGNVTFTEGNEPAVGAKVLLLRVVPVTQLSDYINHDSFNAETLEADLDKAIMIAQQANETYNRCLRLPVFSTATSLLPTDLIANHFLKVNSLGTGLEFEAVVPSGTDLSEYAKLTGRAGGQTLPGGIDAGENLYLESTVHATKGRVGVKDLNFYINADYASGDEDARLDFNNGMGSLTLEYLSNLNVRQFTLSERTRLHKTFDATGDFGNDNHAWALRTEAIIDYPTWTLGSGKTGMVHKMALDNRLNDTGIEIAMSYGYVYNLVANSKAAVYGYGVDLVKQFPCVTDNTFIGFSALLCSDVDPQSPIRGTGFRATSMDLSPYTGVRQFAGFLSHGNRGWKFPFLAYDTDDTTELFFVDQSGNGYLMGKLEIVGGDPGVGIAGRLTISTAAINYNNGTGSQAPMSITGSANPVFWGYLKVYYGATPIYIPGYTVVYQ